MAKPQIIKNPCCLLIHTGSRESILTDGFFIYHSSNDEAAFCTHTHTHTHTHTLLTDTLFFCNIHLGNPLWCLTAIIGFVLFYPVLSS